MKQLKNNLDEMQEMKLLQIEHHACQLAFWGLVASIILQSAFFENDFRSIAGESVLLLMISVYLLCACTKNGTWDRKLNPDSKTNLLISTVVGFAVGVFWFAISFYRYHALAGSFATFAFMAIFTTVLLFIALSLTATFFKKHKQKLELQADAEEHAED